MKKLILSLSLGVIILSSAVSCGNSNEKSSETLKTYEISDFSSLNLEVIGEVIYEQTDSFYMSASGSSNLVEALVVSNKNGKLSIDLKNKKRFSGNKKELVIHIGSPKLDIIHFNSVGKLHIKNYFEGDKLTIKNKGVGEIKIDDCNVNTFNLASLSVGTIEVQGTADKTVILSEGIGQIDCSKFLSINTKVESKGIGNLSVYAQESIDISITGIGNVEYYGNPAEIKENISGLGKVKKM